MPRAKGTPSLKARRRKIFSQTARLNPGSSALHELIRVEARSTSDLLYLDRLLLSLCSFHCAERFILAGHLRVDDVSVASSCAGSIRRSSSSGAPASEWTPKKPTRKNPREGERSPNKLAPSSGRRGLHVRFSGYTPRFAA